MLLAGGKANPQTRPDGAARTRIAAETGVPQRMLPAGRRSRGPA